MMFKMPTMKIIRDPYNKIVGVSHEEAGATFTTNIKTGITTISNVPQPIISTEQVPTPKNELKAIVQEQKLIKRLKQISQDKPKPKHFEPSSATLRASVEQAPLVYDWAEHEYTKTTPPIPIKPYDPRGKTLAERTVAVAGRSWVGALTSIINLPTQTYDFMREWYGRSKEGKGREFIQASLAAPLVSIAKGLKEDPIPTVAGLGMGVGMGAAISGTFGDIKASRDFVLKPPEVINVRGASVSNVVKYPKGTTGKTKGFYTSKVGKAEIFTKVKSRLLSKELNKKTSVTMSSGKASTIIKEPTFFKGTRIRKVSQPVLNIGASTKLSDKISTSRFMSMTKKGKELQSVVGAGVSKLKYKVGDASLFDSATTISNRMGESIANIFTKDLVIEASKVPASAKKYLYDPIKNIPTSKTILDVVKPIVDVGTKAHIDAVKSVTNIKTSVSPLGLVGVTPKTKTTRVIKPAIISLPTTNAKVIPSKASTITGSFSTGALKPAQADYSGSRFAKGSLGVSRLESFSGTKSRIKVDLSPKQKQTARSKQKLIDLVGFSFGSRTAQRQLQLPISSSITLQAQKQAQSQKQLQKSASMLGLKQATAPRQAAPFTPVFTLPVLPPMITGGRAGLSIPTSRRTARTRKPRSYKTKYKSAVMPLADLLSVTQTEARTFRKATHLVTPRTRKMFGRQLSSGFVGMRFPTAQEFRKKKDKRRKKRKSRKRSKRRKIRKKRR